MNILEGLKRLYILISLVLMTVIAGTIWVESNYSLCTATPTAQRSAPTTTPMADYSSMTDEELLADLPKQAPTSCTTKAQRLGNTVLWTVLAGVALLIIWLIFRWVVAGFSITKKSKI